MRKKKRALSPEVQEAVRQRDDLVKQADQSRKKVDRLKDELMDELLTEYEQAEEQRQEDQWS